MKFDLEKELNGLADAVGHTAFHTICKIAANGFPKLGALDSQDWKSDEIERELTNDEAKVAAHLALIVEDKAKELVKKIYSKQKQSAANVGVTKRKTTADKLFVKECWGEWQKKPSSYQSKAAFAKDMLDKCENLNSQKKIEDWCREWEREIGTKPAR